MISIDIYNSTRTALDGLGLRKLLAPAFVSLVKDRRISKNTDCRIEVAFVGYRAITQLSTHYYPTPRETDVISLSYFEESFKQGLIGKKKSNDIRDNLFGEIFICVPYARKQAFKIAQSLEEELRFLFIHGLLHVFGYDHIKPEEERHMLKLAYKILSRKKII